MKILFVRGISFVFRNLQLVMDLSLLMTATMTHSPESVLIIRRLLTLVKHWVLFILNVLA